MEEEVTSAASTNPTRGSRVGGSTSTPHGGRRHVHARVHVRSASGCSRESLESPGVGTPSAFSVPDFPRNRSKASALEDAVSTKDEKTLYAYQEQPPAPVSPKPLQPHVHQVAAASTPSVTLEAAAAAAEMLPNPGGQRRMMAAGKTNPLHVWGQEMSFLKSHFFHPQRHRSNGAAKAQSDKSTGATEMRENLTHARVDLWSPRSAEGKGGQSVATAAAAKSEDALHVFGGQAPSPSRARRDAGESSGGQDSQQQGGKGTAGGGGSEGERLLPTSCASESMVRPKSAKANTWASLAVLRMRNMNALRAYSWDQRVFLPQGDGFMGTIFELLASPRVWEKVDWAIRGSAIAILPTLIVCLEPTTSQIFPLPTSVVFLAYWTSKPTLGAGLRETFTVLKAFIISLAFLCIVVAIQPGPKWLTILILFFSLSVGAFVAQQMRVMIAYCFASLLMQYVAHPETTGYKYIGDFYLTLFIGQGFAVGALLFPYIRWSSESARRYLIVMGDAISLSVHGACCSFWVESSLLERQLHVARLRQLRQTIEASMAKAEKGLSEMGYEPHSGVYTTRLKTRMAFLKNVFNIVQSMTLVIEQIAANPTLIETPMCRAFGERIRGELSVAAAAMDATLLRVVDLDDLVSAADMEAFRGAKARYEDAVSRVRDEVILSNEDYRTDNSDILLGFFLFSVEELMELISGFQDAARSQDNLRYFLMFPLRDLQSLWSAFVELHSAITLRHSITRRLKEGIKLSLSMALAAYIQTYALKSSSTNPILGVDTIAFLYRSTGGDSFQYGQGRLLGTVLGCLTGLFGVQLADGSRPVLYMCTLVLTFIGSYVQASPTCGAIGNGMSNGVISVVLQYTNRDGAIVRIEQNCFAVIIYFIVTSLVWPVRCQTKVKTGFDGCMRMGREVTDRLLRNLDLPHSAKAVSSDAMALLDEMQKKVSQQLQNLTGAQFEPTMDSAEFPEMAWCMLVSTQRKLVVTLLMMRHAYATFMSSTIGEEAADSRSASGEASGGAAAAATSISVHWVVLHRISPYTRQLSLLLYEAMEVYLLLMSKVTFVPTSELTRLRLGMMQCYDRIVAVYIETIQHELRDSDEDDNGGGFNDDKDMVDTAAKQAESAGQTTAPVTAGTCVPVFTPSGLVVDAGVRENRSFLDSTTGPKSHADLHARRRRSKLSKSANSERKKNDNGGGRVAYKLRPAERQLLREYMLGQHTASTLNASFFASATAMAADQETGGPSAALGNVDAGASVASHSIFNLNGIFFDRRASMLDPALLRNAGIVVQEPVHEEPKAKRSNSTVPATLSAHPSTMHSSRRPSFLNLRSSVTNVDGAVVIEVPGTEASAVTLPVFPLGLDRSLTTEGPLEGAVSAPPSLGHSCISVASLGGDERQQQQRQIPGLPALESLASIPPMDAAPATSKAELLAPRPSVLQSYTVVPTNASLAATQPSVVSAAANVQGVSGSGPHGSNAGGDAADQAAPSHGTLLSNSSLLMAATAGGARVVGGDVLALGRAARSTLQPHVGLMGALQHADRPHGADDSACHDDGASERSATHTAAPARDAALAPAPAPVTAATTPRADGPPRPIATCSATVPGEQGVYDERSTAAESSPEFMLDGTPGVSAATASGGNAGTADGEGDWEGAREALGTLLSDRSTHPDNRTGRAAYCTASSQLGATLPTPTAAAAGVDAAADERAASSGTNTFPSNLDINGSFSRVGPAIPAALRSYVEGLAAHQQQQAPPPPALLGNTSYITISSNLPVMNRTLLGGGGFGSPAANPEASVRAGPTLTASAVAAASSSGGGVPAASTSVFPDAAPLAAAGGAASTEDACLRSFGVHNNTSDIADMLRSTHGTQSFNPVLLRLLQSDGEGGSEGAKNEYVLTNSDIHSLEAFLFGLRALITQVEDIERYLLEVVHGREMAKKL
ncbi:conserved hypothetical protein [Leishmania infantum JPCM5]|uniref:Fusaric_acid_resistance_protein-like_-_putative n=2 Tax=Leishmania infantum TaxID=5671 RepID=A0A6L0WMQ4_LEIIN|nr:conserved hypothetical protein [Leishmania infantum JPCM5]CAC9463233.1 Fusaric_acid_resistance_protein-like_-_putative [Leishmania infantum]CBZ08446.1 conserved hypothetical protein [Leishmania infantum JPCM5]SUZ39983.1 Fusaric_acid_resistance_protein-like_-_putative [Leishmania infantum]|eukprot:XP_003392298.1 conserved hypothetical protein [Leishmania infantum JPCM5]